MIYVGGRLTETPPGMPEFWKANGLRIALGIGGSLVALAVGYLVWEIFSLCRHACDIADIRCAAGTAGGSAAARFPLDEGSRHQARVQRAVIPRVAAAGAPVARPAHATRLSSRLAVGCRFRRQPGRLQRRADCQRDDRTLSGVLPSAARFECMN